MGGIDWVEATHDRCLQAAGTAKREGLQLAHSPAAIEAWGITRRTRFHGPPVAICLELTKGPSVSALRTYDVCVIFPIHPLTLARYRDAFMPGRTTDAPHRCRTPTRIEIIHAALPRTTDAGVIAPRALRKEDLLVTVRALDVTHTSTKLRDRGIKIGCAILHRIGEF
jgi:hypothetical protein